MERNYEERIAKMRQDLSFIVEQNEKKHRSEISQITDNSFIIPNEILEKNQFLHLLILYAMGNEPTEYFVNICNLIYITNQRTFRILRDFLQLIPERTLREINSPRKNYLKDCLTSIQKIPIILSQYYPSASIENKVHLTLGGDAASIKTIQELGLSAIYNYMALPLKKNLKPCSIHICPTRNGTSPAEIVEKSDEIIQIIENTNKFIIDFVSTDGDAAFDFRHKNFFSQIEELLFDDSISFRDKIMIIKDIAHIPVGDPHHILKNGRSHILNHLLLVDPQSLKIVNIELFQKVTEIKNAINDKTSIGAMKDSYAFEIFSWDTFNKLISNSCFDSAFYILPFTFLIQAICSQKLNKDERLNLLHNSVKCFLFHLTNIRKSSTTDFFTSSFSENALGTLFGEELYVIRCINTCIALSVALVKMDEITFSRIGTHDIEIFFGKIRILSFFNYTYENALRSAINAISLSQISNDLNYQFKIRQRINQSGAYVQKSILLSNKKNIFNFEFITESVLKLLRGEKMSFNQSLNFQMFIDSYSAFSENSIKFNHQTVFSGTLPHNILVTCNYASKILPNVDLNIIFIILKAWKSFRHLDSLSDLC